MKCSATIIDNVSGDLSKYDSVVFENPVLIVK